MKDEYLMRTAGSALLTVLLLVLSGCGGSEGDPSIEPLEPEPTSTVITDTAAADPGERPDDEKTEAGAIAFSEFAVRSIIASKAGADPDDFLGLAVSSCEPCIRIAQSTAKSTTVERYEGPVGVRDAEVLDEAGNEFVVNQIVEVPVAQEVDPSNESVVEDIAAEDLEFRLLLEWNDGQWYLVNYSSEDPA